MKKKRILSALIAAVMILTTVLPTSHTTAAEMNDTWISDKFLPYINTVCEKYCICPELVMAIIEHESGGRTDAINGDCKGLMQINEPYHLDRLQRLGATDLYNPYENILVGVDYLAELAAEYEDITLVLDIYSGNSKAFQNYENGIVSDYAEEILERTAELERLHGK